MLNSPANEHVGIHFPNTVDVVLHSPEDDAWHLVLVEPGAWDGSKGQLLKLQQKLNTYVAFAVDGGMEERYPGSSGKRVIIRLDLGSPPDARTAAVVEKLGKAIQAEGLGFEVNLQGA